MPVYKIVELEINNKELFSKYAKKVNEIVSKYGGRYLVRGGEITPIYGNWNPERIVMVEFESVEMLEKCYSSPEYLEIAPFREQSTNSKSIIVEGVQQSR